MPIEILIVGAGAVGAFYASRLALAPDACVSVICRSNYAAVRAAGFKIHSPQYGSYAFVPAAVFPNPEAARGRRWDYVVVSTKALPDVGDDEAGVLEGLVGKGTAVVLVQNGVGVEGPYAKRFPWATVLSAVTVVSAAQPEHGVIQHNRWTRISVGPYLPHTEPGGKRRAGDREAVEANERFVGLLKAGGVKDAEAYDHAKLQLVRWHKIAINASMNPSAVLSAGTPNGAMALDPELYIHLKGVMDEVLTTAPKILGKPFPKEFATAEAILRSTRKNTSGSKPSMLLDWEQGKRMELEVILGNPIRIARERGLEMPRFQTLYALLRKAQENRDGVGAKSKI